MNEYIAYHGTPKNNIKDILVNKFMASKGDRHWLGDGIYFYPEKVYAYKWNLNNSKNKITKLFDPVRFKNQGILEVKLQCSKDRTFDLDTLSHKAILKRTIEQIKEFSEECIEGVALNVLFNELGYDEKYDIIVATFTLRRDKMKFPCPRLDFYPEKQICIKNEKCIKEIKEITITIDEKEEFDELIKEFENPVEYRLKDRRQSYRNKRVRNKIIN